MDHDQFDPTREARAAHHDAVTQSARSIVEEYLTAVVAGEDIERLVAADLSMRVRGTHPLAGVHVGVAACRDVLSRMGASMRLTGVVELLSGERSVLAIVEGVASRPSGDIPIRRFVLYSIRGDRIQHIDLLEDDQSLIDSILGPVDDA